MTMRFGRYKGRPLDELPPDYLRWLLGLELREPLRSGVRAEAARRAAHADVDGRTGGLPARLRAPALTIIACGFRAAAKDSHPDRGGSHDEMIDLTKARDALRAMVEGTA
jgi:hypothetical protein